MKKRKQEVTEKTVKKSILKKVVIFMFITSIIAFIFMIVASYISQKNRSYIDLENIELVQLEQPKQGDTIAVIKTSLGEIRAVLYPEYAPKAVENFITLAESGYYDNTYVFHSEAEAFSAAGCPNKNGELSEGYDRTKELVEWELHPNLWPFKGAICSMTTTVERNFWDKLVGGGDYYCGSRFLIVNSIDITDDIKQMLYETAGDSLLADAFAEKGGIPNFSQSITIIGQAYQGLDVVEALASLETDPVDGTNHIPIEDVMILSVVIDEYTDPSNE